MQRRKILKGEDLSSFRLICITCCIADASVWGMIVTGKEVKKFSEETWVKVTGILDKTTYKRALFPLVKVIKIERINKPADPYVYDALPQ
ncbi:TIGR03943 family putative permease subunit [Bacillus luti]